MNVHIKLMDTGRPMQYTATNVRPEYSKKGYLIFIKLLS